MRKKKEITQKFVLYETEDLRIEQRGKQKLSFVALRMLNYFLGALEKLDESECEVYMDHGLLTSFYKKDNFSDSQLHQDTTTLLQIIADLTPNDSEKIHLVTMFEECHAFLDTEGLRVITLSCTPSARELVLTKEFLPIFHSHVQSLLFQQARETSA